MFAFSPKVEDWFFFAFLFDVFSEELSSENQNKIERRKNLPDQEKKVFHTTILQSFSLFFSLLGNNKNFWVTNFDKSFSHNLLSSTFFL